MAKVNEGSLDSLSISMLLEIDRICRRFEAEWEAGNAPQIEAFLGDATEPQRSELLRELQAIQQEHEQGSKHYTSLAEFVQRLVASELVTEDQIQQILNEVPSDQQPHSADDLAKLLHGRGELTAFQAKAVYRGKTRGLVLGNYVILDKLGRGGMGQVFKARHRRMEREVALKMLPAATMKHPEAVRRFQREAKAAARLSHANIVTAHDADEANGIHFLVMEYVEGRDLASLVQDQGPLDPATAVDYLRQAAQGLDYAHRHGVVHRDIKPSNILLDGEGVVKILDMGLARIEGASAGDDALTATGQVMGTLDFMSPEQALDTRSADARADIYSLGCTLYFLLTGQTPFGGDTMTKKILAHRQDAVPSLRAARPDVPEALDAVYRQMLAKQPDGRQQSMVEVIGQFSACGVAAPGSAKPASSKPIKNDETLGGSAALVGDTLSLEASGSSLEAARSGSAESGSQNAAAVLEAIQRLAHQDYAGVIGLLEAIPAEQRSAEADQLLGQARQLHAEVEQLNQRMNEAVRDRNFDGLRDDVLVRLLDIEPGNLVARDLYEHLGTYNPDEPYRFDKQGNLLPAHAQHGWVDRLARLMYQRLNRPKYARGSSSGRNRAKSDTDAPNAARHTPAMSESVPPWIPIAIGLGILGVLGLLLGIVFLVGGGSDSNRPRLSETPLSPGREYRTLSSLAERKIEVWLHGELFGAQDDTFTEEVGVFQPDDQSKYVQFKGLEDIKRGIASSGATIESVAVGPESPVCENIGAIGLIRWNRCVEHRGKDGIIFYPTGLGIALRRDGQWKEVCGILGDWRLGPSNRYKPNHWDHVALQHLLGHMGDAVVADDGARVRSLLHPEYRCFVEGPNGPVVLRVDAFSDAVVERIAAEKHHFTITAIKIQHPVAVTLSRLEHVADGKAATEHGHLHFYAHTDDGWRMIAWVQGDWSTLLMADAKPAKSLPTKDPDAFSCDRQRSVENLKQLGISLHHHHDTFKNLPAAYNADRQGRPLLSWRVHVLPFLDQQSLYDEFHLDESWDSPHNKQLIPRMPNVFRGPGSNAPPGYTNYLGVRGEEMIFVEPKSQDGRPVGCGLRDIGDGTRTTLMLVEASDEAAVEWTRPADYEPDESLPMKSLIGLRQDGFLGTLADGRVHFTPSDIDAAILYRAFTKNDGQGIPPEDWTRTPVEPNRSPDARSSGFVSLFDGKTLNGWHGDPRLWRVVNGAIVGDASAADTGAASYLCTTKKYRDFVLKVKFKLRAGNSGVQVRSEHRADYTAAGIQAEIGWTAKPDDPSQTTGLYFQSLGRGIVWTDFARIRQHFKPNDWNEYIITCQGQKIRFELNGYTTIDYVDEESVAHDGVLGFQIMNSRKSDLGTTRIEFKDIYIKEL